MRGVPRGRSGDFLGRRAPFGVRRPAALLVAAVAVAAGSASVGASSSYALPAFFECAKSKGASLQKGCVREGGKGGYELREGVGKGKPFKAKGMAVTLSTPALGETLTCTSFKLEGELGSPSTVDHVVILLSGCSAAGHKCMAAGQKPGKIETTPLSGVIGLLGGGRGGLDLKPEAGSVFASFECEGHELTVEGSVVGEITPLGTLTKTLTLTFALNGEGLQQYKALEGQPEDVLLTTVAGVGTFESGLGATAANKGEDLLLAAREPCVEGIAPNPAWWATQPDCETGEEQAGGLWHPW